jgi:hypothetical protein
MMEVGRLGGEFKGFQFCVREELFLAVTHGALNSSPYPNTNQEGLDLVAAASWV